MSMGYVEGLVRQSPPSSRSRVSSTAFQGYRDLYPPTRICLNPGCVNHCSTDDVLTLTEPVSGTSADENTEIEPSPWDGD